MGYFPFFMELEGEKGLVAGGGKIALHKVRKILTYGARLVVVAPEISAELEQLALENDICVIKRQFEPADLMDAGFVIAASDNAAVNAEISRLCREKRIPVNVVDCREECGFLFPALVKEGKLSIGISTGGTSPEVAATIRSQLASFIPANIEEILDYLSGLRPLAKEHIKDDKKRAAFLKDMANLCMDRSAVMNEQETMKKLQEYAREDAQKVPAGVLLVGAGCGSYDLITLKGLRAIRRAKVLVYDDLIDQRLLAHASESCETIYVGKRSGRHSMKQEQINELLIKKAKEGGLVVRLKGGDPFVFGRGMEELTALKKEGIPVDYIPGVTSCIAVPGAAGIPVTHREVSRSFHVITGHTALGSGTLTENIDFETLAKLEGTLVFLMGFGHLKEIAEELVRAGKDMLTPAAVIHGNLEKPADIVKGTLADIAQKVSESAIQTPAVIVVGAVVQVENDRSKSTGGFENS